METNGAQTIRKKGLISTQPTFQIYFLLGLKRKGEERGGGGKEPLERASGLVPGGLPKDQYAFPYSPEGSQLTLKGCTLLPSFFVSLLALCKV